MKLHSGFCLTMSGILLLAASGTAGTLNYGFEQPAFSIGNIDGQQGWTNTLPYDAVVSSGDAFQGTQSLRISNGIANTLFGFQPHTAQLADASGESSIAPNNVFVSSWYFKSVTGSLQDGLGITVSADDGAGARMTYLRMMDDSTNGVNLGFYDTDAGGNFMFQQLNTNLDRSVWHRVDMNITFIDGPANDVVTIFVDGVLAVTGTTWEQDERLEYPAANPGAGALPPVNSLMFRASGASLPAVNGLGFYIDNVSLASSGAAAPEPGTMGLLLGGILGLAAIGWHKRPRPSHRS